MTLFCGATRAIILGLNDTGLAGLRDMRQLEDILGSIDAINEPSLIAKSASRLRKKKLKEKLLAGGLFARGEQIESDCAEEGIRIVLVGDEEYPERFMNLANPPLVVFCRGLSIPNHERVVAIVGARQGTQYGRRVARSFALELSERGVVVASGFARGVDRHAHEGCLEGPSATLAVLGSGLAHIYPPEHRSLVEEVTKQGVLLTEFAPETPPLAHNFPRRNRLIAALCDVLILVEAKSRSGGLITVRWAAEMGRQVFVVPGQLDNPVAQGVLALMRDGVPMIRSVDDLIEDMSWEDIAVDADDGVGQPSPNLSAKERRLLAVLDHEGQVIDDFIGQLDQTPAEVLTSLLSLELRGLVTQEAGMRFCRIGKLK